jgi:hypothetical protein
MNARELKEHREYLREIVKLKLYFLWGWRQRSPGESFRSAIEKRVDIYRKLDINDGPLFRNLSKACFAHPKWKALVEKLFQLYGERKSDSDASRFENDGFEILADEIDARCERDLSYEIEAGYCKYKCGSLDYMNQGKGYFFIHIANAIAPKSIFEEPLYLVNCLTDLLDRTKAKIVTTNSWLNSHPRWLALFPGEWSASREVTLPPFRTLGWWGQFITASGSLHVKHAAHLRATGEFPFLRQKAFCSAEALRNHLENLKIGSGGASPSR